MVPPDGSPHEDREAIAWLLEHCQAKLTTWELDFLDSIQDRPQLTPKQKAKLNELWQQVVVERQRG